jgi:hypothetical protein
VPLLNEPQVWTLIAVFSTALFGMMGFLLTGLVRIMKAEFSSIKSEFAILNVRIDNLDRDVQFLMRREFGENHS